LRSALTGEPVPIISDDIAQDVITVLAHRAAGALAGRLGDMGAVDDGGRQITLGYVEDRLSRLWLDERLFMAEDPPG
jgi:hypothetical protein